MTLYPMERKTQAYETFTAFVHEVGIHHELHLGDARLSVIDKL